MSQTNGSGLQFPTLELGGVTYVVKFTRGGILYRLNKAGASLSDLGGFKSLATYIDLLHAALWDQYDGAPDQLADLIFSEDKMSLVGEVVNEALKKVFPPPSPAAAPADQPAAPQLQ